MSGTDKSEARSGRRTIAGLILGTDLAVAAVLLAFAGWAYYLTTSFEEVSNLFAQDVPPDLDLRIYDIIEASSADNIESHVRALAGFGTRNTMSDTLSETRGIGAARRWIKAEMDGEILEILVQNGEPVEFGQPLFLVRPAGSGTA